MDPEHHHVILDNDHVRVFESWPHEPDAHPIPRSSWSAFWLDGAEQSWEILSGPLHAFGVEVKAARGSSRRLEAYLPHTEAFFAQVESE